MLPLDTKLRIGIQTIHRRTEPATAPWLPRIDELIDLVQLADRSGYDSWAFRNRNSGAFTTSITITRQR